MYTLSYNSCSRCLLICLLPHQLQITALKRNSVSTDRCIAGCHVRLGQQKNIQQYIAYRDELIRKEVGNTLAFGMARKLESRQIEVQKGSNSIVLSTTLGFRQGGINSSLVYWGKSQFQILTPFVRPIIYPLGSQTACCRAN